MAEPILPEPVLQPATASGWRAWAFRIIFRHAERDERFFDLTLIALILVSVVVVILDSVESIHAVAGRWFYLVEWVFTLTFTVEYAVRLAVLKRPWRYATSFYGIVDLLAIVPTYLGLFVTGGAELIVIGRRGSSRATQLLIGTVSSELVRLSPLSVLVVRKGSTGSGPVLVGIDGSKPSLDALKVARRIWPDAPVVAAAWSSRF